MLRKTAAAVLTCSALAVVGCSSDNDTVVTGSDGDDNSSSVAQPGIYRISFTNLTTGQPMTPPVVALHDEGAHLFQSGEAASPQLQLIAEAGMNDDMVALAQSLEAVSISGVAFADPANPGPFGPDATAEITLETDRAGQVLSAVSMVICTNDGFSGVDSLALPSGSEAVTYDAVAYDAGTEVNTLDAEYWVPSPAPCGNTGGVNMHEDENGVVGPHPGQTGTGDFDFDGTQPVVRIEIERVESTAGTYLVSLTNQSVGQPMTPPVVAIHDPSVTLFSVGAQATPELQAIAESGENGPMVALAESLQEVTGSGVAFIDAENPGPVPPGETATVMLTTDGSAQVLSAVSMIICTNDGFTGTNSHALPTTAGESISFPVLPYDAGTEVNELNPEYWVPAPAPCGNTGGVNLHEDENGVIGAHPGQTNTGNFDFAGTDNIMMIEITRQ